MARALLGSEFERRVGEAIADIERGTAAEVVLVVTPRADVHRDVPLVAGLAALVIAFTAVVFTEDEVGDYALYLVPLAAFLAAYLGIRAAPPLLRPLLGKKRRAQAAEVWARATFQKAALHRTRDGTAVLVFVPLLERACVVVRDHGVAMVAGDEEWRALEARFSHALAAPLPGDAILEALRAMGAMLAERLPPRPDDIDELPSFVRVTF